MIKASDMRFKMFKHDFFLIYTIILCKVTRNIVLEMSTMITLCFPFNCNYHNHRVLQLYLCVFFPDWNPMLMGLFLINNLPIIALILCNTFYFDASVIPVETITFAFISTLGFLCIIFKVSYNLFMLYFVNSTFMIFFFCT